MLMLMLMLMLILMRLTNKRGRRGRGQKEHWGSEWRRGWRRQSRPWIWTRIGKKEVDRTLHVIIKLELEDSWSDSTCHNKARIGRKEVDQTLHVIIKLELEDSWPDSTCHNRARIGSWSKLTCHNRRGRSRGSSLNSSTGTSRQPEQLIVTQDPDCGKYQECVVVFVYYHRQVI